MLTIFFAETEQAAFCPANLIPGIEPSNDKMLQARMFAYKDSQFHRLGPNFHQIPINCPYRTKKTNYNRDGLDVFDSQGTGFPNYFPNSFGGPNDDKIYKIKEVALKGDTGRHEFTHPNDDYEQANALYSRVMDDDQRMGLINNLEDHMKWAKPFLQERQCRVFFKVNQDYGIRVAEKLGLKDLVAEFKKMDIKDNEKKNDKKINIL